MSQTGSKSNRKTPFQHIYDWVNYCDLTQLDAILIALFTLVAGVGLIATLFILQCIQFFTPIPKFTPPAQVASQAQYAVPNSGYTYVQNRFGRPRQEVIFPFANEHAGQAEASSGFTY